MQTSVLASTCFHDRSSVPGSLVWPPDILCTIQRCFCVIRSGTSTRSASTWSTSGAWPRWTPRGSSDGICGVGCWGHWDLAILVINYDTGGERGAIASGLAKAMHAVLRLGNLERGLDLYHKQPVGNAAGVQACVAAQCWLHAASPITPWAGPRAPAAAGSPSPAP